MSLKQQDFGVEEIPYEKIILMKINKRPFPLKEFIIKNNNNKVRLHVSENTH